MSPAGRSATAGRPRPAGRPATALAAALAVLLAATTFLAALPTLPAYRVAGALPLLVATAAGSTLIAFACSRSIRLLPAASYAFSLAGLVLLLLASDGPHPGAVVAASIHGPSRILSETLPLSGPRVAMTAPVLLVWVCGSATSESVFRAVDRAGALHRAHPPAALAIPVLLYLLCFAVTSASPRHDQIGAPLLVAALALTAVLWELISAPPVAEPDGDLAPEERPAGDRRTAFIRYRGAGVGAFAAVAAAAILAVLAPAVPALEAHPAELHRRPPTASPVITDPVDTMANLRDDQPRSAPTPELTVTLSRPSDGYLMLADLDDYDGGEWRFTAKFDPTGGRIPSPPPTVPVFPGGTVTQRIAITGRLPVPLLPALDRPTSVTGPVVSADAVSGMLLPQPGAVTRRYEVVSVTGTASLPDVSAADAISTGSAAADLETPPGASSALATSLGFVAALTGGRPAATVAFMQAALRALQSDDKRVDPAATAAPAGPPGRAPTTTVGPVGTGGTPLAGVINAVTVDRAATPEQFATFYAMIARYLGVPARVVTGFRLAPGSTGRPVAAGTYSVTNRQAWAWVEIPLQGYGWVVCDPTPDASTAAPRGPAGVPVAPTTTLAPRQADALPSRQDTSGHPLAPPERIPVPRRSGSSSWLYAVASAVGLVAVLLVAGPGQAGFRRRVRRRGRWSTDPATLAVGAWLEMLDGLDRAGLRPPPGATATDVAREVGHHFGVELVAAAAEVAAIADRAMFSTLPVLPAADADRAWSMSRRMVRRVQDGLDTRQRIRCWLLVGSAPAHPSGNRPPPQDS